MKGDKLIFWFLGIAGAYFAWQVIFRRAKVSRTECEARWNTMRFAKPPTAAEKQQFLKDCMDGK